MSCSDLIGLTEPILTCLREALTDDLKLHFIIAASVISAALLVSMVLVGVLYSWVYKLDKKLQNSAQNNPNTDFKIRRATVRGQDFPPQELPRIQPTNQNPLQPVGQNPLSRNGNYSSVLDDLNKRSTNQPNSQQPRYPNYVNDNSNFAY
ncbi:hypothetical protein QE152_g1339 [Popillia japonica]|uniref:Uncharacterized protein n=1 Tax=Popillia japonica TaxID=7064 RepID=A0AAW1N7I5_POPJA